MPHDILLDNVQKIMKDSDLEDILDVDEDEALKLDIKSNESNGNASETLSLHNDLNVSGTSDDLSVLASIARSHSKGRTHLFPRIRGL